MLNLTKECERIQKRWTDHDLAKSEKMAMIEYLQELVEREHRP